MSVSERVNILLVDDQPGKLLSYEAILADLGENLIKANSGREALEHLLRTDITIVLIDVSMPELDGFELAEMIRDHPRCRETAIIFVSAVHLADSDRLKGYQTGAVDYLSVPIIPELLRAKVRVFAELYRKRREIEALARDLEERVQERTTELEIAIARQTELASQLRLADRRKDEFLALLAHELRNPLAPLRNAVSILQLHETSDPAVTWCRGVIERQVAQLSRLVDDLLDVSRISLGKIKLQPEPLDLGAVIGSAVETSRPLIDAQGHHLEIKLPPEPVRLSGDRARLTQVIANLLNNAARYQSPGGRIELSVESRMESVLLRVRDEGIGIAPGMRHEIFELFSQAEHSPNRAPEGLGIGLSLVRTVVELHGGMVGVESPGLGQGSTFTLSLPCTAMPAAAVERPDPDPALVVPEGPAMLVLVLDDNRDAADSLSRVLELGGHTVLLARESEEALRLAMREKPAVVLLDIGLPGMDGYEICRRMRQNGLQQALIVAMTGYGLDRDRDRSRDAGFDAHLVKPVPPGQVLQLLLSHAAPARTGG